MEHIIVEQNIDDVEIVIAPNLPKSIMEAAISKIFPAGSEWASYKNARSFRFTNLKGKYYLLSYTLILGKGQNMWNGTLRSWGLIDHLEAFLSEDGLKGHDPQQLFQRHKSAFLEDPFYEPMARGLDAQVTSREKITSPIGAKLFNWLGIHIPAVFSLPFTNPSDWVHVESALYHYWRDGITIPRIGRAKPMTFTTLTLTKSENTKMKGIPEGMSRRAH
jgi:hypothetical protein